MNQNDGIGESAYITPERDAADEFLDIVTGFSLEQISRVLGLIAEDLTQARADAADVAEEARAIRKLLESEG